MEFVQNSLQWLCDILRFDLLIGFGVYSIAFSLLWVFRVRDRRLRAFDESAWRVAMVVGIGVGVLLFVQMLIYIMTAEPEKASAYLRQLTGPYWLGYILQIVIPVVFAGLLRVKILRGWLVYRLLMLFFCVFGFEQYVILVTSFHRDFLPSSWAPLGMPSWADVVFGLPVKMFLFLLVAGIYYFWRRRREQAVGA